MDNNTIKETISLHIISNENNKICSHENCIMITCSQLIHELQNTNDAYKAYRSIKNAMNNIEVLMRMIYCCKDSIIDAYKFMNDDDC